jgi:chemotaxis protein CheY-P-specific phosphatase CheC
MRRMHEPLIGLTQEPSAGLAGKGYLADLFREAFQKMEQSLGQLLGRRTAMARCSFQILRGENFFDSFEDPLDQSYFASILKIDEIFRSNVILLISARDGISLYRRLTGEDWADEDGIPDEVVAGIGELNNILGNVFINSLANLLRMTIHAEIPLNTLDLLGAILQDIVLQEEYLNRQILTVDAAFECVEEYGCKVRLIILSDWRRFNRILDSV